jgi:hypothetical protein
MLVGDPGQRIETRPRPACQDNALHGKDAIRAAVDEEPREVQHDPEVLEGDDEFLRQPASPIDPYTPETHPRPGERRAWATMRYAWIPILIVIAIIIYAAVR